MKKVAIEYLNNNGIKPSMQRVAVMEYLLKYRSHPTADEIYNALVPEMPTLSKTTVYNTLRLFVEQGAVVMLTIDEHTTNFDADTDPHAHFFCKKCSRIYDLPVKAKQLLNSIEMPDSFQADSASLYVRGVCKNCSEMLPS